LLAPMFSVAFPSTGYFSPARIALAAAAGVAIGLMVAQLHVAWLDVQQTDFRVFYDSGRAWLGGTDLYATTSQYPNLNPPHFIVAFAAFSYLTFTHALVAWLLLNIGCGIVAIVVLFRTLEIPRSATNVQIAIAATGLCMGVLVTLQIAQVTGVLMLMLTTAWSSARRGSWKTSAVILGLLVSIKPFFACLLLIPLLRRRHAALAIAIATGATTTIIGIVIAGQHSFERWMETGRLVTWFHHPVNASLLGLLARVRLTWWPAWAVLVAIAVVVSVAAVRRSRSIDVEWALLGVLSILISPLGWVYYVPVVAAPIVAAAFERPAVAWAALGIVWPIPLVIALFPITPWSMVSFGSIQTWSLIAMWTTLAAWPKAADVTAGLSE
jgi:arabinofuranan 3-O-arabinosyltransferase